MSRLCANCHQPILVMLVGFNYKDCCSPECKHEYRLKQKKIKQPSFKGQCVVNGCDKQASASINGKCLCQNHFFLAKNPLRTKARVMVSMGLRVRHPQKHRWIFTESIQPEINNLKVERDKAQLLLNK